MIVITCPKCKHVFETATQPISGTIACPSCGKSLRLRPKHPGDAMPPMARRPAKSARRALVIGLAFLVLVLAGVAAVIYKLATAKPKPRPRVASTAPAQPTSRPAGAGAGAGTATSKPAAQPPRRRPGSAPPGYQIGD